MSIYVIFNVGNKYILCELFVLLNISYRYVINLLYVSFQRRCCYSGSYDSTWRIL